MHLSFRLISPLLNNFYFNPNRDMKSGYCSIVAKKMTKKYVGEWTCAALLAGRNRESWDDFRVNVFDNDLSAAQITGMVFGIFIVIATLLGIGFITHKRGLYFWRTWIPSESDSVGSGEAIQME